MFWIAVLLLLPPILWLADRFSFSKGRRQAAALVHTLASLLFPFVQIALAMSGWYWFFRQQPGFDLVRSYTGITANVFLTDLLLYWVIVGAYTAFLTAREAQERALEAARLRAQAAELDASLTEARLNALRSQLHPHFLFNTLNAIATLAEQRNTAAVSTLTRQLSGLLRTSLDRSARLIPLQDELEFTREYLQIEQTRCGARLAVRWRIDPGTLTTPVPSLLLQPLVENAIKHGVAHSPDPVEVEIGARADGQELALWVRDTGPGLIGGVAAVKEGVGISNTRARLAQLYGTAAALTLSANGRAGLRAEIVLPAGS
jgi:sensor histidine kinase YesM